MDQWEDQLKRVGGKLQLLLRQYASLQAQNEKLKAELQQLQMQQQQASSHIHSLQQQVEILKAAKGDMNPAEKKAFEKRLSQYIKEIDRCITLLNE